jgi:hypothetical protein
MNLDLFDFFWNIRQQQALGSLDAKASTASAEAKSQESTVADLNHRFERLALVTQALFELLAERAHVSEADLMAKMSEIDHREGARRSLVESEGRSCPKCGHVSSARRATCLYCGATLTTGGPFEGL